MRSKVDEILRSQSTAQVIVELAEYARKLESQSPPALSDAQLLLAGQACSRHVCDTIMQYEKEGFRVSCATFDGSFNFTQAIKRAIA